MDRRPSQLLAALKTDGLGLDASGAARRPVPRKSEVDSCTQVDLQEAERRAEEQLRTCHVLAEAAGSAAELLSGTGAALRREPSAEGSGEGPRSALEDSLASAAGHGLLAACSGLGVALVGLAAVLTGEVLAPLRELQQTLQSQIDQQKAKLDQLDQYEKHCSAAFAESVQRKDKASVELQERVKEREVHGKRGRSLTRIFKAGHGGKTEQKMQHAAQAQTAAVEELAMRADQVAMARVKRDQGTDALNALFAQASSAGRELIRAALLRCAGAWDEVAEELRGRAAELRAGARGAGAAPGGRGAAAWQDDTTGTVSGGHTNLSTVDASSDRSCSHAASTVADAAHPISAVCSIGTSCGTTAAPTASAPRSRGEIAWTSSPSGRRLPQEAASGRGLDDRAEVGDVPPSPRSTTSLGDSFVSGIISAGDASLVDVSPVGTSGNSPSCAMALVDVTSAENSAPMALRIHGDAGAGGLDDSGISCGGASKMNDEASTRSRGGYPLPGVGKLQPSLLRQADDKRCPAAGSASSRDCFVSEV